MVVKHIIALGNARSPPVNVTDDRGATDAIAVVHEGILVDANAPWAELFGHASSNAMEGILGGTDVSWKNGPGDRTVKIDLNVGEITVRLR